MSELRSNSRTRILDAAMNTFRLKGYAATTVDDLCAAAGVTKGSFFHHFASKEEVAVAAADHFAAMAAGLFAQAPYRSLQDPLDRLLGYVDFRITILGGPINQYTCLLGTLVQEVYETHPAIRTAADRHMDEHIAGLEADAAAAIARYAPDADFSARGLTTHMQTVMQGSLIFAKAKRGPDVAADSLRHLRRYLELLFRR
jgi:TetR/AcrR family transcriptional repressor of nem operon